SSDRGTPQLALGLTCEARESVHPCLDSGKGGELHQLYDRSGVHLAHHARPVDLYRLLRGPQSCGDLLVDLSGNELPQYLALAWGQSRKPLGGSVPRQPLDTLGRIEGERLL